jgi:Ca2+-binding RTX toxin-like protein
MVAASWSSSGVGWNGAGLTITGETDEFLIRWGHGPVERVSKSVDYDGDGILDAAEAFHEFPSDGNYDIAIFASPNPGVEPVRMKAFLHASETSAITLGGTWLKDIMIAGSGNDMLRGAGGDDWLSGGAGGDTILGQDGNDLLLGEEGADTLYGGAGADLLAGGFGGDVLHGQEDSDSLYGQEGADQLFGGAGSDYLDGGAGADRLRGDAGADTFVIGPYRDQFGQVFIQDDPDRDTILDFQQGSDAVDFSGWGPMAFVGTDGFSGDRAELRYEVRGGTTLIFGDYDADGAQDFAVRLLGSFSLTSDDVIVRPFVLDM